MRFEIEVSNQTAKKLAEVAQYETLQRKIRGEDDVVDVEDIIRASIFAYLTKVYSYNKITPDEDLGLPYQVRNRFKEEMKRQNIKAKDLANLTTIPEPNLSKIINNKSQPSLDYFLRIWTTLGCPEITHILYREK